MKYKYDDDLYFLVLKICDPRGFKLEPDCRGYKGILED